MRIVPAWFIIGVNQLLMPIKKEKGFTMNKKLATMIAMLVATMLVLCGCAGVGAQASDIYDRLDKLDAYKEITIEHRVSSEQEQDAMQAYGTFRNVPYGYNMFDVIRLETLGAVQAYDNAIDFELVGIFGYTMLPTYWFNADEQMYRGSYYARTSDYIKVVIDSFLGSAEWPVWHCARDNLLWF